MTVTDRAQSLSAADLEQRSRELLETARALEPDAPLRNLIGPAIDLAEPEFLSALDMSLRSQWLLRVGRAMRAEKRREADASGWLFPQCRDAVLKIPARVDLGTGKRKNRGELTFEDLKRRLRVIAKKNRDRQKNNAEVAAIKSLMKLWPARSKKTQGTTLAEIDGIKAKRAGVA